MNETTQQNTAQSSENLSAEQSTQAQSAASTQSAQTSQSAAQSTQAQITPLPTPPTSADSASFNERADNFLLALPRFANELNAFGQAVNEETKERIESTIKSSIDTRLNENEVRLKKELVDEVASQTSGLKRASVRLLDNIPCLYDGISLPSGLCGLNYQLVTRQNDEQHDSEIVDYGDVFVSIYSNVTTSSNTIFMGLTRLNLPSTVGELETHHAITTTNRTVTPYNNYENAGETHIDGARTENVIEGDTLEITKSAAGISGDVSMSAAWGVCEWVKNEDKNEYKFSYRAHLINEPRKDVITLKLGSNEEKINIFIKKRTHTLTKEQEAQRCQWSKVEGNGQDFICWCEQMSDTVLVFGHNFWLTGGLKSNDRYACLTSCYNHGLKFSFPCEVAEIYAPFNCVMVLLKDGSLWHLGNNTNYEAGLGNTTQVQYFTKNPTLKGVKKIFFNFKSYNYQIFSESFFALCERNKLYAWGTNTSGCLGLDDKINKTTPQLVNVSWETQIKDVLAGSVSTLVLLENGQLMISGEALHMVHSSYYPYHPNITRFEKAYYTPYEWYKQNSNWVAGVKWGLLSSENFNAKKKELPKLKRFLGIFENTYAFELESGETAFFINNYLNIENLDYNKKEPFLPVKFGAKFGDELNSKDLNFVRVSKKVIICANKSKVYFIRDYQMNTPTCRYGNYGESLDFQHLNLGGEPLELGLFKCYNAPFAVVVKNKKMGRDYLFFWSAMDGLFYNVAY